MHENENPYIRLVALQGSVRPGNYTARALALVADEVEKHPGISLEIVDPTEMHLPLPGQGSSEDAKRMQEAIAAATGVILAKIMNLFTSDKINPLVGGAGVSAVPMAARVVQKMGMEADKSNHLLMFAMGPNIAGVIGTVIAAGIFLTLLK